AVWTVEPWLSRLEQEASGKVIVEEKEVATTILVSSVKFLNEQRDLAKKFAQAHAELTDWIIKNPEEAQRLIKAELLEETKSDIRSTRWTMFRSRSRRASLSSLSDRAVAANPHCSMSSPGWKNRTKVRCWQIINRCSRRVGIDW